MKKKIFGPVFALLIQFIAAQRISDTKCEEYSKILLSPELMPQSHLVWIAADDLEQYPLTELGTLISEKFVLTSVISDLINSTMQVFFTQEDHYAVDKIITHPKFNRSHPEIYNLELLQLAVQVKLDSDHRPACLWTKNYFETTYAEVMQWEMDQSLDEYSNVSLQIITEQNCKSLYANIDATVLCVQPDIDDDEDRNLTARRGSPIQVYRPEEYLPDNYYIYGITAGSIPNIYPKTQVGMKTNAYLDFIEPTVWGAGSKNCGHTRITLTPLIISPTPSFHGEFPWHAAIYRSVTHGNRNYTCGGSLLNENTVLTAAHCVLDESGIVSPLMLIVSLGQYDLDTTSTDSFESRVDQVIPHEHFNRNDLKNDIAILKLTTPIQYSDFIQPICITNDPTLFSSNVGVVAGWGRKDNNTVENLLKKASLPIKNDTECRDSNPDVFSSLLNGKNFCAGYRNGTSVCSGDSGGGLIFQSDEQWFVRGIVSLGLTVPGLSQCDTSQLALFTDVTKFYDWTIDKL